MAETTAPGPATIGPDAEEAAFYHEAGLNATWTGARLAAGGLTFLFGAFIFAFFYLRSLNSHHLWYPKQINGTPFNGPGGTLGVVIMLLIVVSAAVQTLVLQRIKAGHKGIWLQGAAAALVLGVVA